MSSFRQPFVAPRLDPEEAKEVAPFAQETICAVTPLLKKLLQIDNCTGLALPALRLAQLARKTSSETQFDLQKAKLTLLTKADSERARAAEEKIKAFLEDEYPDAFRLGTETHSQMLRLEVLAQLVIELIRDLEKRMAEVRGKDSKTWGALATGWNFLVFKIMHAFYRALSSHVGQDRYEHLAYGLDQAPVGAQGTYSLEKRWSGGEGNCRRAMIYGI